MRSLLLFSSKVQNPSCLTTGLFQSYQFSRRSRKKPSTEWYMTDLQTHNILSVHQSVFRPLHSTTTSLTDITNTVLQNIEKGKLTGLAFLDLTKAFDTPDHDLLLNKLSDYGLTPSTVHWFRAYLTGRTQSVCICKLDLDFYCPLKKNENLGNFKQRFDSF